MKGKVRAGGRRAGNRGPVCDDQWQAVPDATAYENAFKVQWELFLKHIVKDEPFPWDLREGAKGVQLAEKGLESWAKRCWIDIPELKNI